MAQALLTAVGVSLVGLAATTVVGLQGSNTGLPTIQSSWNDLNHDNHVQRNELCLTCPVNFIGGFGIFYYPR